MTVELLVFNNREIAVLVWAAVFFCGLAAVGLSSPATRRAGAGVIRALFARQILASVSIMIFYILISVKLLKDLDFWRWTDLKTTVLWAFTFAIVTAHDVIRVKKEDEIFFRRTLWRILGATAIIEFIAHFYAFSLVVELVLVPFITLAVILHAVSQSRPEFAIVERLFDWVLALFGLGYLGFGIYRVSQSFAEFATLDTFRDFSVPIVLSLFFLPFVYTLSVYAAYEIIFLKLNHLIENRRIRTYAKIQAVLSLRGDLKYLRRWARNILILRPASKEDVRRSIREIKKIRANEKNPPVVPPSEGWSPYEAIEFLQEDGFVTDDYHSSLDGWCASSPGLDIGAEFDPDRIVYFVDGDEFAAKRLELMLDFNNPDNKELSEERQNTVARTLFRKAIGAEPETELIADVSAAGSDGMIVRDKKISITRDEWSVGNQDKYSLKFIIENVAE